MPDEITDRVCEIRPRVVVDGTFGGGGHARRILQRFDESHDDQKASEAWPSIRIVGLDRDPDVQRREKEFPLDPRIELFLGSYERTPDALAACDLPLADAIVLDLGLSSDQLEDRHRGFSFNVDGPLDLRFDPENGTSAAQWLARHNETEIADAIYQYGEERFSRRIARQIVARARDRRPVQTVDDLVQICRRCVPRSKNHDIHPATRTFQALRIAVNEELDILERTLSMAAQWLSPGGRLVVISFHSLEDRLVKQAFRDDPRMEVMTKKPIRPGEAEVAANPRSRSAKLRVAKKKGNG